MGPDGIGAAPMGFDPAARGDCFIVGGREQSVPTRGAALLCAGDLLLAASALCALWLWASPRETALQGFPEHGGREGQMGHLAHRIAAALRVVSRRAMDGSGARGRGGAARSRRIAWVAAAFCLLVPLLAPAAGQAVTVGAPLTLAPNVPGDEGCETVVPISLRYLGVPSSCTWWGVDASGTWTSQTPPGHWVIDEARVRTGPRVGPMVFTVIRALRSQATKSGSPPAGLICCSVPVESQVFTPTPNTINEIPVNLPVVNTVEIIEGEPIEVVDYLGISVLSLESSLPLHGATSGPGSTSTSSYFAPAVRAGQERLKDGSYSGVTPLVNADYQPAPATTPVPGPTNPTSSPFLLPGFRLLGNGTRARLGVNAPGPGLLRAGLGGGGVARVSVAFRRGKTGETKLLRSAKRRVKKAGKAYITVRLTRAGQARLKRRGKLKLPVEVRFEPDSGKMVSATHKVTFRKPRHKGKHH